MLWNALKVLEESQSPYVIYRQPYWYRPIFNFFAFETTSIGQIRLKMEDNNFTFADSFIQSNIS